MSESGSSASPYEKPRSEFVRAHLTRLPRLTWWRSLLRNAFAAFARFLTSVLTRSQIVGLENFPRQGPALVVSNHLGDADWVIGVGVIPSFVETVAKVELYDLPLLGKFLDIYGVVWVHRGQPDRRALRTVLQGLAEGRIFAIAPEGRESPTGTLEEGNGGAAYLALKAGVPVVPVTVTGTQNKRVFENIKRFRRTDVTFTIGPPFFLEPGPDFRQAIARGTEKIMLTLARQLPPAYRGVYQEVMEASGERT